VRILLTRPQPDATRTATALRSRGHEPIIAPLFAIEILAEADLSAGPWTAFVVTSANALSGLGRHAHRDEVRSVPVFTVGERTAQATRDLGFATVTSANGNVSDLANVIAARLKPPARLLYLAGEDRAGDLASTLRAQNFVVDMVVVYRAVVAQTLPLQAAAALTDGIDGALHFSRRGAETYVNAARGAGVLASALKPAHFCLSAQVAEPLVAAGAADIRVAPRPAEGALLDLIDAA
jgi:uroporphyrinogen-III synthase